MSTVRLGDHELLIRLASGGAANVFLVRDAKAPPPGRLLALKILLPSLASNEDFLKMFFAEAKLAARLVHKNVVTIAGFGQVDGIHCLAMEYVFGASLAQVLRASAKAKKPLTVGVLLRITADVCDALHYAHEVQDDHGQPMGVVHRDVTPQNILVGFNGIPKLTDFGIAKATNRGWETQAGIVKGKFSYMSPEQALGKRVDRRSDIFGTGIVLWEALTGRDLFKGTTPMEVLTAIREQKIEPPSKVVEGLTPIVDPIVMKALRRSPKQRYQTAAEMRDDIEDLIRRAGVAIDSQTISREFAAIYGDEIVERAFALRAAMAGKPDLENLAKVLGGALLNPKHLPAIVPGALTDPDPLGLFSEEIGGGYTVLPDSGPSNGAMPARSEFTGTATGLAMPPDDFEIEVEEEREISNQELSRLEPEPEPVEEQSDAGEVVPRPPNQRALSGWDDSTGMVVPDDELLSMLSEEDATIGYLPPKFADRFGAALKKALEEDDANFEDDEATVGISDEHLRQLRALNRPPPSQMPWDQDLAPPLINARPLRPMPRAPSLDMDRPAPRAPSLDMDGMTPIPEVVVDARRQPPLPPPPPPRPLALRIEEESTGPNLPPFHPMLPELAPLVPQEDEPLEPSMPGESVLFFDKPDQSNIAIDDPTADEPVHSHNGAPDGSNLDDSVLLEPVNPLSTDDLLALANGPRGKTPPPLILPPPQLSVPGMGMPPPPLLSAPPHSSRMGNPSTISQHGADPFRPPSYPKRTQGIRITPLMLIIMVFSLVALGLALGMLLATK